MSLVSKESIVEKDYVLSPYHQKTYVSYQSPIIFYGLHSKYKQG